MPGLFLLLSGWNSGTIKEMISNRWKKEYESASPLVNAVMERNPGIIRNLIEQGADINEFARFKEGELQHFTALETAVDHGFGEIVELLLKYGADVHTQKYYRFLPEYHNLWLNERSDFIDKLVHGDPRSIDHDKLEPLHRAVILNRPDLVLLLLNHGAHIDCKTGFGMTPLALASWYGYCEIIRTLITLEANPELAEIYGRTPLYLALENRKSDAAVLLIKNGANVNCRDQYMTSALHMAAKRNLVNEAALLIEKRADKFEKDSYGKKPVQYAPFFSCLMKKLFK